MYQHVHAIVQGAVVCDDNVYGIVHVIFVFGLFWNSRDFFNLSNDGMLAAVIVLIGDIDGITYVIFNQSTFGSQSANPHIDIGVDNRHGVFFVDFLSTRHAE